MAPNSFRLKPAPASSWRSWPSASRQPGSSLTTTATCPVAGQASAEWGYVDRATGEKDQATTDRIRKWLVGLGAASIGLAIYSQNAYDGATAKAASERYDPANKVSGWTGLGLLGAGEVMVGFSFGGE